MADITSMLQIGGGVDTTLTTAYTVLKALVVLGVFAGLFYLIYQKKQYRYDVSLKVLQNGQFVHLQSKARVKKDENGISFWYVKALKDMYGVPPDESMHISTNGRWMAEGYYDRTAGIIWSKDTLSKEQFQKRIETIKKGDTADGKVVKDIDVHHQPFTTTERSLLASRISRAMQRRGKDIWAMLWQILPIVILVVIFALGLIFWNDIAKPVITLAGTNAEISKNNQLMQEQNIRLYQMLTGGKGNGTYIVQALPSDQQYFMPERPVGNAT